MNKRTASEVRGCLVEGCDKLHRAKGLCATHYNQRLQPDRHKKRDGLRCYVCNRQTRPGDFKWVVGRDGRKAFQAGPRYPTLDHVVALAGGGEHAMDNARLACRDCNSHKSDKSVDVQLLLTA